MTDFYENIVACCMLHGRRNLPQEEPKQYADTAGGIEPPITDRNCNIKPVNMISDWPVTMCAAG
jgi:hypothetical protein